MRRQTPTEPPRPVMEPQPSRFPPYATFFTTLLLIFPVHLLLPLATVIAFPYTLVGLVSIGLGLVCAMGQQRAIARHRQGGMYTDTPTRLITDGPFRFTRNPLYLGMVLLTLGIALLLGTLGPLILVTVELLAMNFWGIPYEEEVLAAEFDNEYDTYRAGVRRWV